MMPVQAAPPRRRRLAFHGAGLASAAVAVAALLLAGCRSVPAAPPNVVLIVADDLGYGDLGSYGQQLIQTPSLDRMAREGMRFRNFHAGSAVCLPSRCTLMTGLHTGHCRVWNNWEGRRNSPSHKPLQEEDISVATVLRAAGYRTAMIGKWALGDEFLGNVVQKENRDGPGAVYKHGWDYYYGEPNQTFNHEYYPEVLYEYDRTGLLTGTPTGRLLIPRPVGGRYSHDVLTEKTLAWLDAIGDETFFLYVAYQIPHEPLVVPELEPYSVEAPWSEREKTYASMITRLDRDVGRILERLRQHGIDERTLVLFTSDNGGLAEFEERFRTNGGLPGGKATLQDGGVMVPLIAHWPGSVPAGTTSDEMLAFWDVLPTLADLAGIAAPAPLDGISFRPALLGQPQAERHRYLFWGYRGMRRVKKAPGETRSDRELIREAMGRVLVPEWNPAGETGGSQAPAGDQGTAGSASR